MRYCFVGFDFEIECLAGVDLPMVHDEQCLVEYVFEVLCRIVSTGFE